MGCAGLVRSVFRKEVLGLLLRELSPAALWGLALLKETASPKISAPSRGSLHPRLINLWGGKAQPLTPNGDNS